MKKAELVALIAEQSSMTKKDAEHLLEIVFDSLADALARGERITLPGFGTFDTRQRAARIISIPKTGEKAEIPAARVPVFRPAKQLKEKINPCDLTNI